MLIIKNLVRPSYGMSTTEFHYIPPLDASVDVIRADILQVPYVWTQGTVKYIDRATFDALDVPLFGTPAASGATSVRGLMPHIILILGELRFVFGGIPAGADEVVEEALWYIRSKLENFAVSPDEDTILDFSWMFFDVFRRLGSRLPNQIVFPQ